MGDPQADIWVLDLVRGSRTQLTFGGGTHCGPSWSADGQRVVYMRQNGATVMTGRTIRIRLASGGGQEEVLMESIASARQRDTSSKLSASQRVDMVMPYSLLSPQLSPDGR